MKKIMKSASIVLTIATMVLASACSKSAAPQNQAGGAAGAQSDKPYAGVVLKAITPPDFEKYYNEVAADFQAKTGATVKVESVAWDDLITKLTQSMVAGGTQYDIVIADDIYLAKFAQAGWLKPTDEYMTDALKNDLTPATQKLISFNGHYYGLPWYSSWKTMVYNKDLLKKAGYDKPPQTWDEFIKMSQDLQAKGLVQYASSWSWNKSEALMCDFIPIVASFGGKMFDDQGKPSFNSDAGVQALQLMVDMVHKYKIVDPSSLQFSEGNVEEQMSAGKNAFEFNWGVPTVNENDTSKSKVANQTEMALLPAGPAGTATTTTSGVQGISYGSKNPKAAWDFINFMNGPEGTKRQLKELGGTNVFPGYKSLVADKEVIASLPGFDTILKQGQSGITRPQVAWYQEWSDMMQSQIQQALTQSITPKQALDAAAQQPRN
ncbi:hypothetical protein SD70_10815 [Gordoniibacillus kamchatkensis]|uniref:ABC transporter substrate-binding protein n=1 Tax=Gordoniibacillus kamchatkensis TaxID=1590651 RepID=A0ABR5AIM1_9BACL|nr:extracellular solute-binding protein [Paenibacillus sp. VKM B-2647]KIL40905.1 hypothetical protein SD70_10815 [Paenibacillus sp. VKM B-2647]